MSQENMTPPEATVKVKRRISPFWLLPFIALLISGWLVWNSWQEHGTTVTIDFVSADGIVPGRTPVRYQGVEVGTVQDIQPSKDLSKIIVTASIKRSMQDALRAGTQFWLVTPKASLAGVSGLDALVGGNYIGMMPGPGKEEDHFTAQDSQPRYRENNGALMIHLQAPDLGALSSGSKVYYRKVPVGHVYDYTLSKQGVSIDVLIDRRFANLVKQDSRFWNVSGLKTNFSFSGASIQLESLAALVNGAIAFDSPQDAGQAPQNAQFTLYPDIAQSQRGVHVTLSLPGGSGLRNNSTPLMYQGLQVGTLTKIALDKDGTVTGELTVDPSVVNLLREGTRITLAQPKVSLDNPNLSALLTGSTLELHPGDGKPQHHFTVVPDGEALLDQADALALTLTAPDSYGVSPGQPVLSRGIQVGQVVTRTLTPEGVKFTIAIDPTYRSLVRADSKFIANSKLDMKVGLDGVEFLAAPPAQWLNGGINLLAGNHGDAKTDYPLFANSQQAKDNQQNDVLTATLTLTADNLPDIQQGSVVLYRKFAVGQVISIKPHTGSFDVGVYIEPQYRNLLTPDSVFWAEGGAKIQLNGHGLTVQASPLNRAIRGAISFDSLPSSANSLPVSEKRKLWPSETAARAIGGRITLHAYSADKLASGMPIRYLGIDIGQVESLSLITERNEVQAQAVLYPEYANTFARKGTRFSVVTPQISAAGVANLDTLIQPYINVEPGKGGRQRDFDIQLATISDSRYLDGLSITVEVPDAGSLSVGTPVLFRGIEVGTVTGLGLGTLSDRVMVSLRIGKRYQDLVRNNSVFWLASGYKLDFGLVGGVVKTGTFNQFIRGGIAFATPPSTPLSPKARTGQHFLLLDNEPKDWRDWGTAIPR
ncbi:PqiB family protein [Mangrovibacter yixingensis]|uniref:PqiB family protein n=1 Tax=Mangrovibacter yixingensis TaxID=1529639 RepID=UPI001CFA9C8F|nr:PqiB family protein [Mangrovibacter yixingensis]